MAATVLLRPAIALALIGVMLATGCDSDGSSSPPTTPNPTTSSTNPTSTATPTGIRLPEDVTLDFDWTPTGDAKADAAVQTVIQLERAQTAVVAYGDRDAAPYTRYVTGAARTVFERFFDSNIEARLGLTGTRRYFDFDVSDVTPDGARVVFCQDGWDIFAKNRDTGEVIRFRDPRGGVKITETVAPSSAGQWRVKTRLVQEGVPECRLEH